MISSSKAGALSQVLWLLVFCLGLNVVVPSFAQSTSICPDEFAELSRRQLSDEELDALNELKIAQERKMAEAAKVTDLDRLRPATIIASVHNPKDAKALSNLPDGIYIWGVDDHGHVAVMNRNVKTNVHDLDRPDVAFLGSHSGALRVLQNRFGGDRTFVSTGEIVRRDGRTVLVDNRSGTFPKGGSELKTGLEGLKKVGLEVSESETAIRDVSTQGKIEPHREAYLQVPIEIRVMNNPQQLKLYRETLRVMKKIDRKFKDREELRMAIAKLWPDMESMDVYNRSYIMDRWKNTSEGTAYIFNDIYLQEGSDETRYKKLLELLESVADATP